MVGILLAAALVASPPAPAAAPASPLIAPADIDDTLEIAGEDIKARDLFSRMTVPVQVEGRGPFRFIVDSGADRTVIGARLAERLGLEAGRPAMLHSMSGSSIARTVRVGSIEIGRSVMEGLRAPVLDEANLGADGIVGIDALADQRLQIDFDRKTIVVQDSRRAEASAGPDEIVVTARRRHGQLILTQAYARNIQLSAVIDTGAQITVANGALRARLDLTGRRAPREKVTLISVTGEEIVADLIVLREVRVGTLTLLNVPIAFVDVPPFKLFGLADEPAMLLGTDVLQAFRKVALDFRRRRVRFTLRR